MPHGSIVLGASRMRRLVTLLLTLFLLGTAAVVFPAQQPAAQQQPQTKGQTVYITKTGKKYHRAGCRYLASSKIPRTLKDAQANGYTPCSVCKPPR